VETPPAEEPEAEPSPLGDPDFHPNLPPSD